MKTEQHPAEAFTLNTTAFVEVGDNGEQAKTAPVRLVARTGDAIVHPYWGKISHDLEGFSIPGGRNRIALDYVHDDREIVGYANKFDTDSGDLVLSGALTPFKEGDRASEIIFKSQNMVPYEASINFASDKTVLQRVEKNETVEVNGREFEGPGVIVKEWELRSCAICPSGADSGTSVALFNSSESVGVQVLEGDDMNVVDKFTAAADPELQKDEIADETTQETTAEVETETVVEAEAESDSTETAEAPVVAAEAVVDVQETAPEAEAELSIEEGRRMFEAFGAEGAAAWFEGETYDGLLARQFKTYQEENAKLRNQLEELKSLPGEASDEDEAVSFSAISDKSTTSGLPIVIR